MFASDDKNSDALVDCDGMKQIVANSSNHIWRWSERKKKCSKVELNRIGIETSGEFRFLELKLDCFAMDKYEMMFLGVRKRHRMHGHGIYVINSTVFLLLLLQPLLWLLLQKFIRSMSQWGQIERNERLRETESSQINVANNWNQIYSIGYGTCKIPSYFCLIIECK